MARKINAAGLALVKAYEGIRLKAYPDPGTGGKPWTIGYGHTRGVKPGMTITAAEATDFLIADLADAESAVERYISVPLNDNQFAALVSFTFNCGTEALRRSTLRKRLNAGDYASVPGQLAKWTKAGGRTMDGLVRRRRAEGQLWSMPFVAASKPASAPKPVPAPEPAPQPQTRPTASPVPAKGLAVLFAALAAALMWFWDGVVSFIQSIF